jgi:hypothetical protein
MNKSMPWVVRLTLDSSTREVVKAKAQEDRRSIGNYVSRLVEEYHRPAEATSNE